MTHAIVLIQAERTALADLGGQLADVPGVAEAYSITGEWDFAAILRLREQDDLAHVITEQLAQLPGHHEDADAARVRGLLADTTSRRSSRVGE